MRKRLRIRNRELLPMLDDILGEHSFAKMTRKDGERMVDFMQPRNWMVIEKKIELAREMVRKERLQKVIGDKFSTDAEDLENEFGLLRSLNETTTELENAVAIVDNLPPVEPPKPNLLRELAAGVIGKYLSEDAGTKLVGLKSSFHTPMRMVLNISRNHENRMKASLAKFVRSLSVEERQMVAYLQAGAKKQYKGEITERARQTLAPTQFPRRPR